MTTLERDVTSFTVTELPGFVEGQWKPERTGDYATDCRRGREAGAMIRSAMQESGNPAFLSGVASAIVAGGEFGGFEVGLFTDLGIALT